MEFQQAAIALLASMVLVLAGMVGWIYWQQTRMFQNMNAIVGAVGELAQRQAVLVETKLVDGAETEQPQPQAEEQEDDRASVDEESPDVPVVDGPPAAPTTPTATAVDSNDVDGLESKPKKELQEILTKRGIPFGKNDNKATLISLLKATA